MATTMTRPPGSPPPGRQRRLRAPWVVAAIGCLLVAVVFVVTRANPTPNRTSPTLAPPAASTPARFAATPNWTAVAGELLNLSSDIRAHPNPARLTEYLTTTNPSYAQAHEQQAKLADGTWRYDPTPAFARLESARVIQQSGANADLLVKISNPRYRVVDADGVVVYDGPAASPTSVWHLVYRDGQWLLNGVEAAA